MTSFGKSLSIFWVYYPYRAPVVPSEKVGLGWVLSFEGPVIPSEEVLGASWSPIASDHPPKPAASRSSRVEHHHHLLGLRGWGKGSKEFY